MDIQWDKKKNKSNQLKHGLSFEEALDIFADPFAIEAFDESHSSSEERYKVIGQIQSKVFVVALIYADIKTSIRIISARKATHKERLTYEKQKRWF